LLPTPTQKLPQFIFKILPANFIMFPESDNISGTSAESDTTLPFSVPELIKSAQRAFQLLEPWCKAEQKYVNLLTFLLGIRQ
jgi:hypothetical protein